MAKKWTSWAADEDFPPTWEKEKGNELIGIYKDVRGNVGKFNSNVYTVEQENGEDIEVFGDKILDSFFKEMPKGTEIKITHTGKKTPKGGGNDYHTYKFDYNKDTMPDEDIEDVIEDIKE